MRTIQNLVTKYIATDPDYPYGKFKDDATPGDFTGSEDVASYHNEIINIFYSILVAAGLTPNNQIEKPGSSQIVDAIKILSVPIGTTLMWWDFNGLLTLPYGYVYTNGQTINDPESSLNGQTLDDMSNRAIIGYGTEGGQDVGSSPWITGPIGNPNHFINIQHDHNGSLLSGSQNANHTHPGPSHFHGPGTLQFRVADIDVTGFPGFKHLNMYWQDGTSDIAVNTYINFAGAGAFDMGVITSATNEIMWTRESIGTTANSGTGSTGSNSVNHQHTTIVPNDLSSVQSIHMRSIRYRFITRIK